MKNKLTLTLCIAALVTGLGGLSAARPGDGQLQDECGIDEADGAAGRNRRRRQVRGGFRAAIG